MVVTRTNLVHALLYLVVSLFAVAVVFYTLGAPFVAALEVIVYAGAIMMLFLFAVMLLNVRADSPVKVPGWAWVGPGILVAVLLAELVYGLTRTSQPLAGARGRAGGRQRSALRPLRARRGARLHAAAGRAHRRAPRGGARPRRGRGAGGLRARGRDLMAAVSLNHALVLAAVLFAIGFAGLLARRNLIVVLACIEIMLNAAGLAFVAAGARWGQADGQVMFLFVLAMAAAEVAVGLAIAIRFRQSLNSLDVDDADEMKG